ncbi:hypothetical protein ParaMal1_00046 [Paracoccus phage ParMal1]|uniref:Uncharacterized protein n=1 Tax=Paracoccus phage ParMal1 TaxID=3032416 RepID=A0AAF0JIU4_9CAUD|nr:hypothetical protein ParaMal1_00046 [Paracoccus phage ParMal1]
MTKVLDCTLDDMEFLIEKAQHFNDRYYGIPLNLDKLTQYLTGLIAADQGVVLRTETGAITGVHISDPCRDWEVLVETAWYSEGRDGLRLLAAFEDRGMNLGVDEVRMTTLEVNAGVEKVLTRRGYTRMETSHRLIL